jgi:DNA-binding SARP family transcriptional activator
MGGFRVFRGRTLIKDSEWKSRRAKTLLKLLVAHQGNKLPRERIIEMLWPDLKPENGRPLFNSMLHRLRKVIEPKPGKEISCIHHEEDVIALNKDRVWTDVRQFRYHLQQAERLKAAGRSGELITEYERMVELYKGDFLPENLYSDWTIEVRDQLRSQYLRVLEEAGALADARGEKSKAMRFYEKMFLSDSCSEKACRWLMSRYLAAGQRSEAIRTYERCERALSRELDLEPEEKTKKLYRSIIGG